MRGSAFIAFFGIATAISGSMVGCGDDDGDDSEEKPAQVTRSKAGESCATTNDCEIGLACYSNVCLESATGTGGSSGTGGAGGKGGTSSTLGTVGESCTRRADCNPGLGCYSQRCAETETGEAGAGNTPPITQGARGETCVLSSDCASPLVCLPNAGFGTTGSIGVCTDANTDVEATGDVCGAECETADHCCQIPVELHATIGVKTCTELLDVLDGVTCDAAATVEDQARCLVNDAFCEGCTGDTWLCTAGRCIYDAECTADGLVPGGCPTVSRAGFPLTATCDVGESDRCQLAAVDPLCTDDVDCDGLPVSDDALADTCAAGECTCFELTCLRRCDSDLDCRVGFACDMGDEVCIPEGACTTHVTCQRRDMDIRATCVEGACTLPCATDLDCNAGGLIDGGFNRVCGSDGMCQVIGCTLDADCGLPNGVKMFCTAAPDAAAARAAQSAITD